ncbi:hypothetical protein SADUNF_Sadunf09G0121900 [Salix dunnii]|uniref:Uncharacterized protein n=1 Tax=Salix dunnii TaxID=1413687 RepID=A0A835JX25_9ROSI|nr:hypothetical protein SADUNF_Sadunf09G0121900 [Salix dunnii]
MACFRPVPCSARGRVLGRGYTTCFDAFWFCYRKRLQNRSAIISLINIGLNIENHYYYAAPVHQMQQYYRVGVFDNCSQKWSDLIDCLTLKNKRSSEAQVSLSLDYCKALFNYIFLSLLELIKGSLANILALCK